MALDNFNPYLFVSAGEQSNKFLTPTYADGVAQFQAQRAQSLTGLTARIDPIQEGNGDPSPTNIRPISGRTGMTVTRAGKNLFNIAPFSQTINGCTLSCDDSGKFTITGTPTAGLTFSVPFTFSLPGTYTISTSQKFTIPTEGCRAYTRLRSSSSGSFEYPTFSSQPITKTFTDGGINGISVEVKTTFSGTLKFGIQIENGGTATAYEPYAGHTYPITWESSAGTVYGGTLDVVSGVLTVDWDYIASYNGETLPGEWISDRDVYEEGSTPTTGAEVAYKLAEPVTYQMDPEQILTLPGFNQIYSDAGPIIDIKL